MNSRPTSPRSRSHSPKSDVDDERQNDTEQTKRVLKEIGNENGNDVKVKEDINEEEDDVNILKEKLRKLEDDSKCSKCMVSQFVTSIIFFETTCKHKPYDIINKIIKIK